MKIEPSPELRLQRILVAAQPLSAWRFARDVGNYLHPGIDYRGAGKRAVIRSLLLGSELHVHPIPKPVPERVITRRIREVLQGAR